MNNEKIATIADIFEKYGLDLDAQNCRSMLKLAAVKLKDGEISEAEYLQASYYLLKTVPTDSDLLN